jgi:hypothetical protein
MTLAVIFLLCILCGPAPNVLFCIQEPASQSSAADKQAAQPETQDQSAAPAQNQSAAPKQNPTSAKPTATPPSSSRKQVAKRPHRKKKPVASNCDSVTEASAASAGSTASPAVAGNSTGSSSTDAGTPTNCPPAKVIVHQGGIVEQSIQLAGGETGNQASNQRDSANRMLGTTEENLKKISGRQLSESQQDMVNQIHQFMQQSKTAVAAGNLERARTLAWKAELLSEELLKPQQ